MTNSHVIQHGEGSRMCMYVIPQFFKSLFAKRKAVAASRIKYLN